MDVLLDIEKPGPLSHVICISAGHIKFPFSLHVLLALGVCLTLLWVLRSEYCVISGFLFLRGNSSPIGNIVSEAMLNDLVNDVKWK